MHKLNFRGAKTVKLNFDVVVKIFVSRDNVCGIYKDGSYSPASPTDAPSGGVGVGYTTYYGFTAQGHHFSKKSYSHYPLKLVAEKNKTVFDPADLDYLKHIPPQVGDYIAFTCRENPGKKRMVTTWCHSTLFLRRLYYALNTGTTPPAPGLFPSAHLKPLNDVLQLDDFEII